MTVEVRAEASITFSAAQNLNLEETFLATTIIQFLFYVDHTTTLPSTPLATTI